jgi:hypothetical protein
MRPKKELTPLSLTKTHQRLLSSGNEPVQRLRLPTCPPRWRSPKASLKCFCHCDWSIVEERDTLFQIAIYCVTVPWPPSHGLVGPFENWLLFNIWLIKHWESIFKVILLMCEEKNEIGRTKMSYNQGYDIWDVTHLWYWIQTSGIGISLQDLFRAFLYIWIIHLYNFCSSYVKLCLARRGQTSPLFSVLCPKPLLRRCPVPGPEQGLAPNLGDSSNERALRLSGV